MTTATTTPPAAAAPVAERVRTVHAIVTALGVVLSLGLAAVSAYVTSSVRAGVVEVRQQAYERKIDDLERALQVVAELRGDVRVVKEKAATSERLLEEVRADVKRLVEGRR